MFNKSRIDNFYIGESLYNGKYVLNPDTNKILSTQDIQHMKRIISCHILVGMLFAVMNIIGILYLFTTQQKFIGILLLDIVISSIDIIISTQYYIIYFKYLYILKLRETLPIKLHNTVMVINFIRITLVLIETISLFLYVKTLSNSTIKLFNPCSNNTTKVILLTVILTSMLLLIVCKIILSRIKSNIYKRIDLETKGVA